MFDLVSISEPWEVVFFLRVGDEHNETISRTVYKPQVSVSRKLKKTKLRIGGICVLIAPGYLLYITYY